MLVAYLKYREILPNLSELGPFQRVTFHKYIFENSNFKHSELFETDVIFDSHLNQHEGENQHPDLGPTELLLGFFEFYSKLKEDDVIAPAKNHPFCKL